MRPCLYMRVGEKFIETCTSNSKLVVSEMLKQKYSLHILTNECIHQTDLSFLYFEAQNTCSRGKGSICNC